jgi:VWFA-related protein
MRETASRARVIVLLGSFGTFGTLGTLVALVTLVAVRSRVLEAQAPILREGVRAAVEVTAMDIDVVATKGGENVDDLTRDEFIVKVDGKKFPLDYFTHVAAGALYGPDLAKASPDVVLETTQGDAGNRYMPRHFLIFFDDEHLLPFERKRVMESLRDFVTRLVPSDRVAIMAYGGSTRVVVPFTNSKEDLLGGLSTLEKTVPSGFRWESQLNMDLGTMRMTRGQARDGLVRNYSQQVLNRERATLNDVKRAVSALAARSGKRVLLFVSHGLELHPGQSVAQQYGSSLLNQYDYSVANEYQAAIREANRSGVTVHSIDARGLAVDNVDASESGAPDAASETPQQASFSNNPFFRNQNRREALAGLADETGGLLIENRNRFQTAMDRIYKESSTYYSLGVTLSNLDPKKKEHSVNVSTTRPGVTVRNRKSYAPKTAVDAARDRLEMALLTPDAEGDFPVAVGLGAAKKGGGLGRRIAPFQVRVPFGALAFVEQGGKRKATVEITLAAVEDNGARSDPATDRQEIVLNPAEKDAPKVFSYSGELKTRTGNIRFVATVRDVTTNRVGIGSASVRVE